MWNIMLPRGYYRRSGRRNKKHHHHHHHHQQQEQQQHHHHHHQSSHHHHSSANNKCQACKSPIGTVTVNGNKVRLSYCQRHYCAKVLPGGILCTAQNNGKTAYCDNREWTSSRYSHEFLFFFFSFFLSHSLHLSAVLRDKPDIDLLTGLFSGCMFRCQM